MTRRPGSTEEDPEGGRAAERLRQELESRFPGGVVPTGEREPTKEEAEENKDEVDDVRDAGRAPDREPE
jgi:hypothetical protein